MKLFIMDTETTGKPPRLPVLAETVMYWPHVIQLSFMILDTETFRYTEHDYMITSPIDIENDHIHGITTQMNKVKGFPFQIIYPIFKLCMEQCDLVIGHNISFDLNMMHVECLRHDIQWIFDRPIYCTMKSSTFMFEKWPRLEELHNRLFQDKAKNLHNARVDVIVCLRCYMKMMHNIDLYERIKHFR